MTKMNVIFTKAKMVALLLGFLLTVQGFSHLDAQVTVGAGIKAEKGAALELKEKSTPNPSATDISSLENSEKGVLFPKVSLKASDQLTPLYGGVDQGNGDWTDLSTEAEKLLATGMIVYNVNENAKELGEGLYVWRISEWVSLAEGIGHASFEPIDCSSIRVRGSYIEGTAVNNSNYITMNAVVTKIGSYTIVITSGNGYSFYLTGVILEPGPIELNIPSQGLPITAQTDKLSMTGADLVAGCEPEVIVQSSVGEYSMNCVRTEVNGLYLKGTALKGTANNIIVYVNVYSPGSYHISTPKVHGIRFEAIGTFAQAGTFPVTLAGEGTPTTNEDFKITIDSNTTNGNNTCEAVIPVVLPAMTYGVIGNGIYSWAAAPRKRAFTAGSFAVDGIVKIVSFNEAWHATTAASAVASLGQTIKPDVILYFAYEAAPTPALSKALSDYINAGGAVIYGSADGTSVAVNDLMTGIFNLSTAQAQMTGNDDVYPIPERALWDDPIVNGPFGNLSGGYWGEDNASTGSVIMTEIPFGSVQICSAKSESKTTQNQGYSIVWYNEKKNFVYIGDSTGASYADMSTTAYPTVYSTGGLPQSKAYGPGGAANKIVYNAALEMNAVAWAVKKAVISGINPH